MKIAWVQLNSMPEGESQQSELFNLIRSKTSFCSEIFLFFTQFRPKETVESTKKQIADRIPSNIHILFPVRSTGNETVEAINMLWDSYNINQKYDISTVTQIGDKTAQEIKDWNPGLKLVKGSFHFYGSEDFCSQDGSLFSLHLNTSVSPTPNRGNSSKSLLYPEGIDKGFADANLKKQINDSKIAIVFGEKGSSLWIDHECRQLINYITYNRKTNLYLCGGETTSVIRHESNFLVGSFNEIQLGKDSCIIGFFDFTCNTGAAIHYTFDSVNAKWEKDYNFARHDIAFGIPGNLFYPIIDRLAIQQGIRAEIADFAEHYLTNDLPSVNVIDWEVDDSQENDSYIETLAYEFSKGLSQKIKDKENYIYVYIGGNKKKKAEIIRCVSSNIFHVFVFQNNIQESTPYSMSSMLDGLYSISGVDPDNTSVIWLRVNKRGYTPFPEEKSSPNIHVTEIPVIHNSISFAWLNHPILILDMFIEKKANPEKQIELLFAISNDNSTYATQDIHSTKELGDRSEKQEGIDLDIQTNRYSNDVQKGDDRDGR